MLFKLWLVGGQTVFAIGGAGHDDRLFLNLAHHLLRGEWLGSYSQFTLMKGPMYSLWIAGTFLAGVPLFLSQHLLYTAMCALLVVALRPVVPNRWVRFVLFAVVLFNPMTYEMAVLGRVLRQGVYYSFGLGALVGFIGLYARRGAPLRQLLGWAALAGACMGAYWLTREESIEIMPLIVPLWLYLLWAIWRERGADFWRRLAVSLSPVALLLGALFIVSTLNYHYYGWFGTVEFRGKPFLDAYGALTRVTPKKWQPYIPVQTEVRERIYAVSPAFAELKSQLEGPLGRGWASNGTGLRGVPKDGSEIGGGFFMWALRDAVIGTGRYHTAGEVMAYYARLAREVNAACDDRRLAAGPRRSGFVPPWNRGYIPIIEDSLKRATTFLVTLQFFTAQPRPSWGPPNTLVLFADLTRDRLTPIEGPSGIPPEQRWLDRVRVGMLQHIGDGYVAVVVPACLLALAAMATASVMALVRRRLPFLLILNVGLLGLMGASITINSLVDAMAFPSISAGAFALTYPFYMLFLVTAWIQLAAEFSAKKNAAPAGTA